MSVEKVAKPSTGAEPPDETDEKAFHYIYVLKKQGTAVQPPKPQEEQNKEDKEDNA